jgi:YfiH family protein
MTAFIQPDWPAPDNVVAFTTTRQGGVSAPPYESLNLGFHVGDAPAAVAANRELLAPVLPSSAVPCWLQQIHSTRVVEAGSAQLDTAADAAWSRSGNAACAVLTADCLPVLLSSLDGDVVAAVHAGWRGLVAGIVENTVQAMACEPDRLIAWLGPAISQPAFEVGPEVRDQFLQSVPSGQKQQTEACFLPGEQRQGHYYADLYSLARIRLHSSGVHQVYGGGLCTYSDSERFYSYRRHGETGRMASVIALKNS